MLDEQNQKIQELRYLLREALGILYSNMLNEGYAEFVEQAEEALEE